MSGEGGASSDVTLGALAVAIGADLAPLQAKLAEARTIIEAFDRDMASGSAGLLQFNDRAKGAGDALAQQTQKANETGKAMGDAADRTKRLTEENERMTRSSREASAALETEAQKNERLASVIDRAVARAKDRENLTTRTGPLSGITSAGIPADYRADQGVVDSMMGTAGGKIPAEALAVTSAAGLAATPKAVKAGADALKEEVGVVKELGKETKISSLSIREIIVLIREMGRGDFTRMAGSATLLAQSFGAIEAIGAIGIFTVLGLGAAVALFGVAAVSASKEANQLANVLSLSGDKAGFTVGQMRELAGEIGEITRTSHASNLAMIEDLTKSNDFTKEQIGGLVLAAQKLSRATGESAEDITKDFAKMAANPLKYAEAFQHAHIDIISPAQMAHLRDLDKRGEKEEELSELIKLIMDGIAQNTADNLSYMTKKWQEFMAGLKNMWAEMQSMFRDATTEEKIGNLTTQIHEMDKQRAGIGVRAYPGIGVIPVNEKAYTQLVNERSALQEQLNAQQRVTDARGRDAQAVDRQNRAINDLNTNYLRGVDRAHRFTDDVAKLQNRLADAVRMPHVDKGGDFAAIRAAAMKSTDQGVRDVATNYEEAVNRIKKVDLPNEFKADAKAAREAAAEAKRLAREAEALEKRRQQAITTQREEADALAAALPLYRDQSLTLDEVNKRKAIAQALSRVKLTAESAEGQELAKQVGRVHDYTAAIQHETQAREILLSLGDRAESLDLEAKLIGKSGWALAFEEAKLRALSQAMKDHIPITDEFLVRIITGARAVADASVAVDSAKFFEEIDKQIGSLMTETETMGKSASTTDYATIRLRLLNEAKAKHIELTDENIRKIEAEARLLSRSQAARGLAERMNEYDPTDTEVKGSDYHALDQTLGGKFKQKDDLKALDQKLRQQRKILKQYHTDSLMDEKEYQRRLKELEGQGAAERLRILHETANLQLDAGQQIADSLASMAKDSLGEQSKAYRALFDISKAFAIAKAGLAMFEDISEAASKGFPQNIPLMAKAAAEGAMIISNIRSIALTFAGGGQVRGPGTATSDSIPAYLSDGEFVVNAAATASWLPMLEAINSGRTPALSRLPSAANDRGPRVTVHNHAPGVHHEARYVSADEVEIIATRVAHRESPKAVASDMASPNSKTSRAVTQHFDAKRRRS